VEPYSLFTTCLQWGGIITLFALSFNTLINVTKVRRITLRINRIRSIGVSPEVIKQTVNGYVILR
jgi:hypothetical protein